MVRRSPETIKRKTRARICGEKKVEIGQAAREIKRRAQDSSGWVACECFYRVSLKELVLAKTGIDGLGQAGQRKVRALKLDCAMNIWDWE